jgi:DNA replication protein DnaC
MYQLPNASSRWLLEDPDSARLKAQYPDLWADPQQSCITCHFETKPDHTRTFLWWNGTREDVVEWECNCTSQWIMHRYLLSNGIGKSYQRLGWADAMDVPEISQEKAMSYLDNSAAYVERGMNMLLHSPDPGTGKTLMLMLIAKGLMYRHHDVFVAQMNTIVEMYTSGWRDKADKDHFERRIMNCGVLCIDDWGKESGEKTVDFIDRLLDRVIRHRTAASAPTLATTNLTPEQLDKGYNQYVASLLTETCLFVETSGLDWRPKARERTQNEVLRGLVRPLVMA